jgi:hypothetical protein
MASARAPRRRYGVRGGGGRSVFVEVFEVVLVVLGRGEASVVGLLLGAAPAVVAVADCCRIAMAGRRGFRINPAERSAVLPRGGVPSEARLAAVRPAWAQNRR